MILRGKVGDGQGYASDWLRAPIFTSLLGQIHPATINIFVEGAHNHFPHDQLLREDGIRRQGFLHARDCTVNGAKAHMLRTEHPGPSYRRGPPIAAPHTMFEIVGVSLIPGIQWGAEVSLEFDPDAKQLRTLRV
jgi:hypothetical protein